MPRIITFVKIQECMKMMKDLIKWRPIIIGIIIVIALYIVSNIINGQNTLITDFLLTGIAVGFMVGGEIKYGAINGAIFGLIGGIITTLILVVMFSLEGYGSYLGVLLINLLLYLVAEIIVAVVGGILGTLIKAESEKLVTSDSADIP